jgi:hypothetical protein
VRMVLRGWYCERVCGAKIEVSVKEYDSSESNSDIEHKTIAE